MLNNRVLKRSLSAHLVQVNLLLVTFYLNGGLRAVAVRKPFERMSNFGTFWFLKTESEQNVGLRTSLVMSFFTHIPSNVFLYAHP